MKTMKTLTGHATIKEFMRDNNVIMISDADTMYSIEIINDGFSVGATLLDKDKLDFYIRSIEDMGYQEINMTPYEPKRRYRSNRTDWDSISRGIGYSLLLIATTAVLYLGAALLAAVR